MDDKTVLDRTDPEQELRGEAIAELRKRRELAGHVIAFIMVNTFLVVVWTVTGSGFFWPVFPIFFWGIGIVLHAWDVLWPQPSEETIRAAMTRMARRR